MARPPSASMIRQRCTCGFLERSAAEPGEAIVFDAETNEYHIVRPQGGYWIAFHCPMCGGMAPESRRHELFATITEAEADRLEELTGSLVSVDQAIAVLGKPAQDDPRGMRERLPAKGKRPPKVVSHRVLLFTNVSKVADVMLTDHGSEGIRFSFHGKYLGKPRRRRMKRQQPKRKDP